MIVRWQFVRDALGPGSAMDARRRCGERESEDLFGMHPGEAVRRRCSLRRKGQFATRLSGNAAAAATPRGADDRVRTRARFRGNRPLRTPHRGKRERLRHRANIFIFNHIKHCLPFNLERDSEPESIQSDRKAISNWMPTPKNKGKAEFGAHELENMCSESRKSARVLAPDLTTTGGIELKSARGPLPFQLTDEMFACVWISFSSMENTNNPHSLHGSGALRRMCGELFCRQVK